MTAKHNSAEWRKTARIVRNQVAAKRRAGAEVYCWRCGREIDEEQRFDVGHIDPLGGEGLDNAAPEHRKENRSNGGRIGARITNNKKSPGSSFQPLPWA